MPANRPSPAKEWCFTWNNYPDDFKQQLENAFTTKGAAKYIFQQEVGEEQATPHIQGAVAFTSKIRPFPYLGLPQQIRWASARGTWADQLRYCSKSTTKVGPTVLYGCRLPREPTTISKSEFYPWQEKIHSILEAEPDERKIYWLWESIGNVGKSAFVKYMVIREEAIFCAGSRTTDIINLVYNAHVAGKPTDIIIWDLPRQAQGKISFGALEMLKNGLIANMKYETGVAAFATPHIIVLSNDMPIDMHLLSQDRWVVRNIVDKNIEL